MTKRAFLVLGPESSGTRLMTRLLMAAGCVGDGDHYQRWDEHPPQNETLAVWRRSVPHGDTHDFPDLAGIVEVLQAAGYEVQAVVMSRDWHAMAISQEEKHTGTVPRALANTQQAYRHIFTHLPAGVPYELVNYEALVQRPTTLYYLLQRLGLPQREGESIYDGNARYYKSVLPQIVRGCETLVDVVLMQERIRDRWGFEPPESYVRDLVSFVGELT